MIVVAVIVSVAICTGFVLLFQTGASSTTTLHAQTSLSTTRWPGRVSDSYCAGRNDWTLAIDCRNDSFELVSIIIIIMLVIIYLLLFWTLAIVY